MTIVKDYSKTKDFMQVSVLPAKSKMSMQAIGLWCYLMTLPPDWHLNLTELETHFTNGKNAVRAAFKELVKNGYIKKRQKKDLKTGHFLKFEYIVYEMAQQTDAYPLETENLLISYDETKTNNDRDDETKLKKPRNVYERIEKKYSDVWEELYRGGKVRTESPAINFAATRKIEKSLLHNYSEQQILDAIYFASKDNWIVKNGFSLQTILSATCFNKLINSFVNEKEEIKPEDLFSPGLCPECGKELKFGMCPYCGYQEV